MKTFSFLFLALLAIPFVGISQNSQGKTDDFGRVALMAFIPQQVEGIPASANQLLLGKMQQIAVQNGIGGSGANPQFCIVPMVNVISKEITPTAPPMHALNLEVVFYIVDAASQSIFSQTSISFKGVGATEDKAYIAGLKNLNVKASQFKGFIETGKAKIMEYYNSQCDVIMKGAQALAGQKKYQEALTMLFSVPDVSRECFDKCMDLSIDVYKQYANYKCTEYMSGAKAAWAAMNTDKAAEFLGKITPDMDCYPQAVQLTDEIKQKMLADGANTWTFKMKQYDATVDKEKMMIQAGKEVAVAQAIGANRYNWNWLYPNSTFKQVDQPKVTTQAETTTKNETKVEPSTSFGVLHGKVISYNGNFKGNFNLIVDGDFAGNGSGRANSKCVYWDDTDNVFFIIDLGDVRQINGFNISNHNTDTYVLEWSLDNVSFQKLSTIESVWGKVEGYSDYRMETFSTDPNHKGYEPRINFSPVKARYIKIRATVCKNCSLSEVQLLGY